MNHLVQMIIFLETHHPPTQKRHRPNMSKIIRMQVCVEPNL